MPEFTPKIENASQLAPLEIVTGGFHSLLIGPLSKYAKIMRDYVISRNKEELIALVDLYDGSRTEVTEHDIRLVLKEKAISDQDVETAVNSFKFLTSLNPDSKAFSILKDNISNIINSAFVNKAWDDANGNISKYAENLKEINVDLSSEHELDKVVESVNLSGLDLKLELKAYENAVPAPDETGINEKMSHNGYIRNQLICVAATPGTGKSLFLIQHALKFIEWDYKVHYFALGDLSKLDFAIRMISQKTVQPMTDVSKDLVQKYAEFQETEFGKKVMKNLDIKLVEPGVLSIQDIEQYCVDKKIDKPGHILIIDYDGNLKTHLESSYQEGIEQYNVMKSLCSEGRFTLVLTASQLNRSGYDSPKVLSSQLANSVGKLNVIDVMIGISRDPECVVNQIGYISLLKVRRGGGVSQIKYLRDSSGRFCGISDFVYGEIKHRSKNPWLLTENVKKELAYQESLKKTMSSTTDSKDDVSEFEKLMNNGK